MPLKFIGTQILKLFILTAFVLPSLVPAGFMVQRNNDTLALELMLCSSSFSQVAFDALSPSTPGMHSHHTHHLAFYLDPESSSESHADVSSQSETGSAEPCPLAGPGAIIAGEVISELTFVVGSLAYSEQTLVARATALLPPPGRGPPTLS